MVFPVGPVHYSRDPQTSFFSNFFIKNESHSTIYTFKIYFAVVFFNFQFSTVSKRTLNIKFFLSKKKKKNQVFELDIQHKYILSHLLPTHKWV